ncbi:PAS domain S-box protein [Chamaesiphon minutus]|uniref:histidine kinase n=1 Tax=Chamaesiphon minutus (strain ATCC 27169 / PCC 6605) TaxID=1173020 RepID=K9UL20_CHAP6|nr:PAS domain S-box protein [Chamaesiphon minutus]AFY95348.1 PAS domain S-box [Chamaesiphon minutus PCC 6605]
MLEAESVAEGLEICQRQQIDGVLLDYALPDADGLEFLAELSARTNSSLPPVVMMTGQGSESVAVRAIKAGAQDYLVKRDLTPELLQLTMRKAVENARLRRQLQQCQERFKTSIDNMRECVSIFSAIRDDAGQIIDFRFDYLNQAALENNRMTAKDIGKSLCKLFPAFRTSGLFEEYCQLIATGEPLIRENLVYEDVFGGETLTRVYSIYATKLDDGFVSCCRDETAKRQAEQDLQAANEQIIDIWESMTDAYVTVDRDWRIIYANQAATQSIVHLTRLAPAEFIGKSHWDLFPSLVGGDVEREYRRALTDRVVVQMEVWFEPNASWFEAHLYPAAEGLGIYFRDITDRKQMEAERLEAQQERDRFFNLSIDLLAIGNFQGYFTRLNPAWEKTLGYTHAELMARPFVELVHPDDRSSTEEAIRLGLSESWVSTDFENRYRCKDGSYRWLSWSTMPYPEQNLMYGIARDITDRKQMEAERLAAEQERDRFFNLSVDLLAVVSFDGYFVRLNPAFEQILGFTNAELMAEPFINFLHPDDREQTIAGAQSLADGKSVVNFENRYRCKDGTYRWVSWNAIPHVPSQVWYTIGHDITERKQMEAALQASERKFSAIFEQSFELMGIVSLDGVLLEVNQTALDSISARKEDIAGQYFWDTPWWHTEQLQQQLKEAIDRAIKGKFSRYEVQFPAPNGTILTTDFSIKPVLDETDRVVMLVAEARDITDRKQAQATLEARNRELDSFVHIVSHDLKAPLRAVANLSKWIEEDFDGSLSPTNQRQMELLRGRIQRMEATIDGLLDYARIGRTEDCLEPVSVSELLAETIETLAPPPTFNIAIAQNLPTLHAKRMLLSQVFTNLIGNAVKHHDRVDGSLHLGIAERQEFYEFAIADDGPGIAPEQHDRIFQIFQAVNPQQRTDSTGVGLAIVKKIVEAEGGTIRLESQLGRGTTFYFTWPKRS